MTCTGDVIREGTEERDREIEFKLERESESRQRRERVSGMRVCVCEEEMPSKRLEGKAGSTFN